MSLNRIPFAPSEVELSHEALILLENTADELAGWQNVASAKQFVPADYVLLFESLVGLRRMKGRGELNFLELGSGFGVVTLLAGFVGMKGSGIEIHPGLVENARMHAETYDVPVEFFEGDLFSCEEAMDLPDRFRIGKQDIVYVYPWPDQELEIFDHFHKYARSGALLLTYYGVEDIRLFEKV